MKGTVLQKMDKTALRQPARKKFVVSVEGNIGSGKSTFLSHFASCSDAEIHHEPVPRWCDVDGHNLLSLLYQDPQKWSFSFQSMVQLTRLQIMTRPPQGRVKLIERSLQNNRHCFLDIGREMGALSEPEHAVLTEYYDWMEENLDIGLDLIVYLRTSPEVAYQRTRSRNRPEEKGISLAYIQLVHAHYEKWLLGHAAAESNSTPVLVINANQSKEDLVRVYQEHHRRVLGLDAIQQPAIPS